MRIIEKLQRRVFKEAVMAENDCQVIGDMPRKASNLKPVVPPRIEGGNIMVEVDDKECQKGILACNISL